MEHFPVIEVRITYRKSAGDGDRRWAPGSLEIHERIEIPANVPVPVVLGGVQSAVGFLASTLRGRVA